MTSGSLEKLQQSPAGLPGGVENAKGGLIGGRFLRTAIFQETPLRRLLAGGDDRLAGFATAADSGGGT